MSNIIFDYKVYEDKINNNLINENLINNNIVNNKNKDNINFYYTNKNICPGRGFGNLNISNNIRNINSSRINNRENKIEQEKTTMFDHKFQYLDKNVQDPKNLIMPIPRGGTSTRDKFSNISKNISKNNNYKFSYN